MINPFNSRIFRLASK